MKHFSKQLSWLLAFVLIVSSIVSTGIPASANNTLYIDDTTNEVVVNGTHLRANHGARIQIFYYESADSETPVYVEYSTNILGTPYNLHLKSYAWHIECVDSYINLSGTTGFNVYELKAYPHVSLDSIPGDTQLVLAEGTRLAAHGKKTNVSVYLADNKLTDFSAYTSFLLPSVADLCSSLAVDEETFRNDLELQGFHIPNLTKLYYSIDFSNNTDSYDLNLTLIPTIEVTFNENTGTPDLSSTIMYATPYASIIASKLPTVSLEDMDFYGWKKGNKYVYYTNRSNIHYEYYSDYDPTAATTAHSLSAIYQERPFTFKIDLDNQKITGLKPNRKYKYDYRSEILSDANGEIAYADLNDFFIYSRLILVSNSDFIVESDMISLEHKIPDLEVEYTDTTAKIVNIDQYTNCLFAIRSRYDPINLGPDSVFTGLTAGTSYTIYAKQQADENGFESDYVSYTFTASKEVSNELPNGISISDIPVQIHSNNMLEPSFIIKDGDLILVQDTDYTVSYSNFPDAGIATATVNFTGKYRGTMTKTFTINHDWDSAWSSDENTHWYECSFCQEKKNVENHILGEVASGTSAQSCTVCGYKHSSSSSEDIIWTKPTSWLVSYDGNEGTGSMANSSVLDGETYTLPASTFTAPTNNKVFKAWRIAGTEYAPGATYTITRDTTITAIWEDLEKAHMPIISPKGGSFSGSQTITITDESSDSKIYYTTDGSIPTTESTVYTGPFTISSFITAVKAIAVKDGMINSDTTIERYRKIPTYTIKFNANGGSTVGSMTIDKGSVLGTLPTPTKEGYVFKGWYSDKKLTKAYVSNQIINASRTLYAKWTKAKTEVIDKSKSEFVLTIGKKDATVFANNKRNDVAPMIIDGQPMLPARFVAENLGAKFTWNSKSRLVTIKGKNDKGKNVTLLINIDSDTAYVNGKKVKLSSAAYLANGRAYTPMSFVAENLGASVKWIKAEQKIVITKK